MSADSTIPVRKALVVVTALAVAIGIPRVARAAHTPAPASVVVPGSLQDELGCSGDWQPDCDATALAFDANDQVWQQSFGVPAGM